MAKFQKGDRVRVKDRLGWPCGYKIADWEGTVVEIIDEPNVYLIIRADKTGYNMAFYEDQLDRI